MDETFVAIEVGRLSFKPLVSCFALAQYYLLQVNTEQILKSPWLNADQISFALKACSPWRQR